MTIEHTIAIEAPPDRVWDVAKDVEAWPTWTPTVRSVVRVDDGPFGLGSEARIKQPAQAEATWTVTAFESGKRFAWETSRPGLWMRGTHEVHPSGSGTTSIVRLEARGAVAMLFWPLLWPATRWALAQENTGLKAHCEAHTA